MAELVLAEDGRLVLPKEMRELLGLKPGDIVEAVLEHDGIRLRTTGSARRSVDIGQWIGSGRSYADRQEADDALAELRDEWV